MRVPCKDLLFLLIFVCLVTEVYCQRLDNILRIFGNSVISFCSNFFYSVSFQYTPVASINLIFLLQNFYFLLIFGLVYFSITLFRSTIEKTVLDLLYCNRAELDLNISVRTYF